MGNRWSEKIGGRNWEGAGKVAGACADLGVSPKDGQFTNLLQKR